MHDIEDMTAEIVRREGGFVNDPDDPGGATNFGVTIHTLRALRGTATAADVKALTEAEAIAIFKDQYFKRPKINQLPAALQATVYDMQVNAGGQCDKDPAAPCGRIWCETGGRWGAWSEIHWRHRRAAQQGRDTVCRCLRYCAAQLLFSDWRPAARLAQILRDPARRQGRLDHPG